LINFKTIEETIAIRIQNNSQHQLNSFDRQSAIYHSDKCLNGDYFGKIPKEMSKHSVTPIAGDKDWDTALENGAHMKWNESKSKIMSLHIPILVTASKKDKSQRIKDKNDANFPFSSSQASTRTLIQEHKHTLSFGWDKTFKLCILPPTRKDTSNHESTTNNAESLENT
jgi:hypothetical protein